MRLSHTATRVVSLLGVWIGLAPFVASLPRRTCPTPSLASMRIWTGTLLGRSLRSSLGLGPSRETLHSRGDKHRPRSLLRRCIPRRSSLPRRPSRLRSRRSPRTILQRPHNLILLRLPSPPLNPSCRRIGLRRVNPPTKPRRTPLAMARRWSLLRLLRRTYLEANTPPTPLAPSSDRSGHRTSPRRSLWWRFLWWLSLVLLHVNLRHMEAPRPARSTVPQEIAV